MSDIENRPDPDLDAAVDADFEADFADFLQGKGELSSLLQALPQPAPAAELDQKILAATRAALQREAASRTPTAANDPAPAVSPIRRWRIPIGIAASLVLTLTVTLQMQQHHADEVTVQAEMLERTERPAPAAAPAAPEPTPTAAADAPIVAEPVAAPPRQAKKAAQPSNHDLAAGAGDSQLLAKRQQAETAAASRANAKAAERRVAQAQVTEQEKLAHEQRPSMAKEKRALDKTEQETTALQAKAEQMAAESAKRVTEPATEPAKPVAPAAPPPQPARMAAAGPAPAARMAPNIAASSSVASDAGSERDYLARIEQALKQGRQRAALEEWERFRRIYPAYPVPPELQKQIEALKKASGQPAEQ